MLVTRICRFIEEVIGWQLQDPDCTSYSYMSNMLIVGMFITSLHLEESSKLWLVVCFIKGAFSCSVWSEGVSEFMSCLLFLWRK